MDPALRGLYPPKSLFWFADIIVLYVQVIHIILYNIYVSITLFMRIDCDTQFLFFVSDWAWISATCVRVSSGFNAIGSTFKYEGGFWVNKRQLLSSHGFTQNQLTLWKYPSMDKMAELTGHTLEILLCGHAEIFRRMASREVCFIHFLRWMTSQACKQKCLSIFIRKFC